MNRKNVLHRLKKVVYLLAGNLVVFTALVILFELGMHLIWAENPFLGPPFAKSKFRIANPVYGHTLAPNFAGDDVWGPYRPKVFTNSLGFRDARVREIPLHSERRRVLFLGDSFTEGLGVNYEETFVGRFAAAFPDIDVLNAGVSSYAPSVYYAKAKDLLEKGLEVDEVIVYIDISDIQDEASTYRTTADGTLEEGDFDKNCPGTVRVPSPWWAQYSYTLDFFYKRELLKKVFNNPVQNLPWQIYGKDFSKGAWTYSSNLPCYDDIGVEGGIAKARDRMDRLHALLSERRISLSVGVYPWPQQLLYDDEESRQVTLWREWCEDKCRRFLNHFPAFFAYKDSHPNFLRDLFIWGDSHFNAFGNEVLARDLITQYRSSASERNR